MGSDLGARRHVVPVVLAALALAIGLVVVSPQPAAAATPVVHDDAYSIPIGGSLEIGAPGLRSNDDPLPSGLHMHEETTMASSSGFVQFASLNDDGSATISVDPSTAPGEYDLEYCYGPTNVEGSACTSNIATVAVTVTQPHVGDDA